MPGETNIGTPLRLIAHDETDLEVMAACLQDAALRVGDMGRMVAQRRFALVVNRLRWEDIHTTASSGGTGETGRRVRCGLHFDGVLGVSARRIRRNRPDGVLSLLTIRFEPDDANRPGGFVTLVFSGGGEIRLAVESLNATCADMSGPWPARGVPDHNTSGVSGGEAGDTPGDQG